MSGLLSSCLLAFFANLLTVAAASDLSSLAPDLSHSFEAHHPGVQVKVVNGASAMLRQQIENGAPFDVFLSANAAYVEELAGRGRLEPQTVRTYALGRVAIIWKDGSKHPLRDLTTSPVRTVALPNPKLAPYGVAAEQALRYGGLWGAVQPKVVYGENVRQTLQYLESGNADAALTSDALLQGKPGVEVIPADWHQPIIQKAGVVSGTKQESNARAFTEFLLSPEAQAIFARFGFSPPDSAAK